MQAGKQSPTCVRLHLKASHSPDRGHVRANFGCANSTERSVYVSTKSRPYNRKMSYANPLVRHAGGGLHVTFPVVASRRAVDVRASQPGRDADDHPEVH